jgi:hypothetical protein
MASVTDSRAGASSTGGAVGEVGHGRPVVLPARLDADACKMTQSDRE